MPAGTDPVPLRNIGGSGAIVDLTVADGECKSESSKKKLTEAEERTGGQSSCMHVAKRARGEMDAPQSEPMCSTCSRKFSSWKAVLRHVQAHSDQEVRAASPPA